MKIEILTKNVDDEAMVRGYIQRKVNFAIDRISSRVHSVTVRLEDETKDSTAFDGVCRIEVELLPRGHVHVSSTGDSVFDCVLQATRKMEQAVKHDIDRKRQSSGIRHQKAKSTIADALESDNPHANESGQKAATELHNGDSLIQSTPETENKNDSERHDA